MKVLRYYLRERLKILLIFMACGLIWACVFRLYHLEMEAIGYAFFLMTLFLGIVIAIDFWLYVRKHRALTRWLEIVDIAEDHFVSDMTLSGHDYQALISQLRIKNQESEQKNAAYVLELEDYFTLWAHQIKLPIAAMKLLLETEEVPDKYLLKSELFRIDQYSDMVMAFLRTKSDHTDYVFAYIHMDEVIRQVIRKFSMSFIVKKIRLRYEPVTFEVLSDEKWLAFVLEQILSNALKYTTEGTIAIYALADDKLVIEDTGIGIEASDLPRIFEKGFTGFNGRTDKKASGLGLYLCRQILHQLSHDIHIESQVGCGTKVILSLGHDDLEVE